MARDPQQTPWERHGPAAALARSLRPGNRRWLTPLVALILMLALVAGALIVSSVTRRHVQLDDGTVWITSLNNRKAARFNVKVKQADAAVSSTATRFDVAQHDAVTILDEGGEASSIDASTVSPTEQVETGEGMTVLLGGDTVAFLDTQTGDVWTGEAEGLDGVDPTSQDPSMRLGAGGLATVDDNGVVYGLRVEDGAVLTLDGPQDASADQMGVIEGAAGSGADSFTVVDGVPVASSGGTVMWPDGSADTGATGDVTLQEPPADGVQSGWVAAAGEGGLNLVDLTDAGAEPVTLSSGGRGLAARPVSANGCVYAAWSQKASNYVRVCAPDEADVEFLTLEDVSATSELKFRTNHRLVVLNDVLEGNVWNPDDSTDVIRIQWNTLETEENEQENETDQSADNARDFSAVCSAQSGQISAEDDAFGVRVGARQILDVLRNDQQTDCSVLRIDSVSAVSDGDVTISPIYDGRYLQLDASAAESGTVTFSYEISDGRGQTSSADVTLTLSDGDNRAPAQSDVPPEVDVEQGASYTANALASFSDPDGDPLTLVGAVPQNTDEVAVSTRADGQLVFSTGSLTSGRVGIDVTVSDGRDTGTGTLYFSVRPANTLTALIDPVVAQTTPGTETTVDLEPYVHATSIQTPQLTGAEAPTGASVTANATDMTFTFTAQDPGTYYVPYTITQGTLPATGLARVEVQPVAGNAARPIAANDVALLGADNTAIVEPLRNDVDPLGGVLSVTEVAADPSSGIKTGVVSNKRIYLTASQIPVEPVEITYTVANAAGVSQGVIVLQPPALTGATGAPKAENVTVGVRTGGIVSVDVLDHVSYADGTTVTLDNELQTDEATFHGLAFVSGDTVRYQADDVAGTYDITYTVHDNLGNAASATITVSAHERDAEHKSAPTPKDVEAQVAAGSKVRIPITLTGIDVDGDDDVLLGLGNAAPTLGRIAEVGADYMIYEAYPDSSGTDVFSYAVEDWTGQRAQAQVRVGVFSYGSDSGVVARNDEVTLRPNTAASVPVTINDISGDDAELTLDAQLEQSGISGAVADGNAITFTTPGQAGTAYIGYTISDEAGLSDTGTLTVHVDPNAAIEPPTAYDYRVPASATIDKRTVEVDVAPWIANPSGTTDELEVGVDSSAADHASVKGGEGSTVISVELTDQARAVPYTVTNTTYGITSTAFIQVPAYGVFPPTLRPKAPELRVNARETITIAIADYVRVGAGKTAYIDGADTVSATKAANDDLVADDTTLKFTAPADYAGPASITFTAADGKRDGDQIVNSAVITLPITVVGRDVPPPTFSSTTIDVAAGEAAKTIDLTALTHKPSGLYEDETAYTYAGGTDTGAVTATVTPAGMLTVQAAASAVAGTTASVPITVTYQGGTVSAGITVRVIQSTRPLAQVPTQRVTLKAGASQQVNVLSGAYNPFPDTPLTVVSCTSDDNAKITVQCGENGTITVSAAEDIGASTNIVLVSVQDATNSTAREVTGRIEVAVVDRPEAPLLSPVAGEPADGAISLSWTPGSSNGSAITDYEVSWGDSVQSCGATTTCQITGLINGTTYSFTVRARNDVGWSDPSNAVEGMPDKVPTAPTDVQVSAGHLKANVSWDAPDYEGTAPDSYTVTLTGTNGWTQTQTTDALHASFDIGNESIADGVTFSAIVRAHNRAGDGTPSEASAGATVWGDPDPPAVEFTQSGERQLRLVVTTGQMRNAGCQSITVSGSRSETLSCSATQTTFDISRANYWKTLTIKVTVHPERDDAAAASTSASVTPSYEVKEPSNVSVSGANGQCVVQWSKQGDVDGFHVTADGLGSVDVGEYESRHAFPMQPWQTCSHASVQQTLDGHTGTAAAADASTAYVYRTPPEIEDVSLTWSDPNTLVLHIGKQTLWNRQATYKLTVNDDTYPLVAGDQPNEWTVDIPLLSDTDRYEWTLTVQLDETGDDESTTTCKGTVPGERPTLGTVEPQTFALQRSQSSSATATADRGVGASRKGAHQ